MLTGLISGTSLTDVNDVSPKRTHVNVQHRKRIDRAQCVNHSDGHWQHRRAPAERFERTEFGGNLLQCLNKLLGTIHAYPTMSEANKYAAGEWKKAHKPEALLDWVERFHAWRR